MPRFKLRRYQERCLEAFNSWYNSKSKSKELKDRLATVILPTGTGKSLTAVSCVEQQINKGKPIKVLWCAHREELISQAEREFILNIPDANIQVEMAKNKANSSADIIVGSVQTMRGDRENMRDFKPDLIVIDEWHHYHKENVQYNGLIERYPDAKVLGLTATPFRFIGGDLPLGIKLIEVDIGTAIAHDYLSIPNAEVLKSNVSLAKVKSRAGDFAVGELSTAVNTKERNWMITKRLVSAIQDDGRQGILFGVDVQHSKDMAQMLREVGVRVAEVYGETDKEERRVLMDKIRNREIDVLCNCLVATEGFDIPHLDFVCIARPTKSLGLYCLSLDTDVLTKNGWKNHSNVTSDDILYSLDLSDNKIKESKTVDIINRPLSSSEYFVEIDSPTLKLRVTNKHNMVYTDKRSSKYSMITAEELLGRKSEYIVPISGEQDAPGIDLVDDEIRFIGWFLSDGTIVETNNQITITQDVNQSCNDDIEKCLNGCGFKYTKSEKTRDTKFKYSSKINIYTISRGEPRSTDKHLSGWSRLSQYIDKKLSKKLENISRQQLSVLLEAIHLGDGAKMKGQSWTGRSYHISTGNFEFAENLQSLCVRRGFKCNLSKRSFNKNPLYYLHIKDTTNGMVGGSSYTDREVLKKSAQTINQERCWCVESEYGTLITRYNGFVSIVGNCQMMGRGLRLSEGKKDCLILDIFDTVKVTQGVASYKKVAADGDIDGSRRRTDAIMKEVLPSKLDNFPVVMRLGKGDAWQIDNSTWFAPSWILDTNQWVVTWSKRTERKKIEGFKWSPMKYTPKKTVLQSKPIEVRHPKYGEGIAHDINYGTDDHYLVVDLGINGTKNLAMSALETKEDQYEVINIDNPIKRAFYIVTNDSRSYCRVIAMIKEDDVFSIETDIKGDETTVNEVIRSFASNDNMTPIVKKDATWRKRAASDKQKNLIKNMVTWGKLDSGIDITTLSGGDASNLMDQVDWKPTINKLFGAKTRQELVGYMKEFDDV